MITHFCGKEDFTGTFDVSDWHIMGNEKANKKSIRSAVTEALNNSVPASAFFEFDDDVGGFSFGFHDCFGTDKIQKWDVTFSQLADAIVEDLDDDRDAITRTSHIFMEMAELIERKYEARINPKTSDQEYAEEIYDLVSHLNDAILRAKAKGIDCEISIEGISCSAEKVRSSHNVNATGISAVAYRPLPEDKSKRA